MSKTALAEIESEGQLSIPADFAAAAGVSPGISLRVEDAGNGKLLLVAEPDKSGFVRENGIWVYAGTFDIPPEDMVDWVREQRERELTEGV